MTTEGLRRHLLPGRALRPRVPGCVVISSWSHPSAFAQIHLHSNQCRMQVTDVSVIWRTVIGESWKLEGRRFDPAAWRGIVVTAAKNVNP